MQNPWLDLPQDPPFVLEQDLRYIEEHNEAANPRTFVHLDTLPEPFLGSPDAPIVLLNLNPGYDPDDVPFHQEHEAFISRSRANLKHEAMEYPFYLLDPAVEEAPGYQRWTDRLRPLIEDLGQQTVAQNVFCVEYFPYHSERYGFRELVPSQRYSFHLVREAVQRGAFIVQMRSRRVWYHAIPELKRCSHWCELNSPQGATISPENCRQYNEVVKRIRAGEMSQSPDGTGPR